MMNGSCSKTKCALYTLFMVLLPIILIIAIVQFAPPSIARLFLNPDKIRSVVEYQQVKDQGNREKKAKDIIKKDLNSESGNLLHNVYDPFLGNKEAKLTIIEYVDYKCGYCKKAHEALSKILAADKYKDSVRVIIKHYPIIGGELSLYAAEVSIAFYNAHPGKFAELHSKLFSSQINAKSDIDNILKGFGTSYEKIKDDKVRDAIIANFNFARDAAISGTPSFIIGDELIGGYMPYEQLLSTIDKKLGLEQKNDKK